MHSKKLVSRIFLVMCDVLVPNRNNGERFLKSERPLRSVQNFTVRWLRVMILA
jgi:hypothetical protein